MVSKTRKRQLRRSNLENDSFRVNETPIEPVRNGNESRNTYNALSDIDINTIIRETVQKELNKNEVVGLTNKSDGGLIRSNSKPNDVETVNVNKYRDTHEVAGNSKTDLNKLVRNGCPDSSVLARPIQTGSEPGNRHIPQQFISYIFTVLTPIFSNY